MSVKPNIPVKSPGSQHFASEVNLMVDAFGLVDNEVSRIDGDIASIQSQLSSIDLEVQKISGLETDVANLQSGLTAANLRIDQNEADIASIQAGAIDPADVARGIEALPEADKLDFESGLKNKPVLELLGTDFEEFEGVTRLRRTSDITQGGNELASAAQILAYVESRVEYLEGLIGEGGGAPDITAGLYSWYSFENQATADDWQDESGNGNHAISDSSAIVFVQPGAVGLRGIQIPGTARRWGYMGSRNMNIFSNGLSFSAFINKVSGAADSGPRAIMSIGTATEDVFNLFFWHAEGGLVLSDSIGTISLGSLNEFDTHHVAVTFNPNGELRAYVDGVETYNQNVGTSRFNAMVGFTSADVSFGAIFEGLGNNGLARLTGHLDEIRLYNKPVTSGVVSTLNGQKENNFPTSI